MKTSLDLFPDFKENKYNKPEYEPIIKNMGEVIVETRDDLWQGDSRILYKDGTTYGFLRFGWGSCSGCDALYSCKTLEDIQVLMNELLSQIRWFDSAAEALKFFIEHKWEMDHDANRIEQKEFVKCVKEYLTSVL